MFFHIPLRTLHMPPCPSSNHQRGYLADGRVDLSCTRIGLWFHWSSTTYLFSPMVEMESRGTNFCNGWACHSSSHWQPFNLAWDLPRSMMEGKLKVGVRGPSKTRSKLCFHSLLATHHWGYSHGILSQFYPLRSFIFHNSGGHWSLLER